MKILSNIKKILILILFSMMSFVYLTFLVEPTINHKEESSTSTSNPTSNPTPNPTPTRQSSIIQPRFIKKENSSPLCTNQSTRFLAEILRCRNTFDCKVENPNDFLEIFKNAESKISFFYEKNATDLLSSQWESKKAEVISNLTTMSSNYENTILLVSSFVENPRDASISNQRKLKLMNLVTRSILDQNKEISASTTFETSISIQKDIDFDHAKVRKIAFLRNQDLQFFNEYWQKDQDLNEFMKNSVSMFTYPCLSEVCEQVFDDKQRSCLEKDKIPEVCQVFCQETNDDVELKQKISDKEVVPEWPSDPICSDKGILSLVALLVVKTLCTHDHCDVCCVKDFVLEYKLNIDMHLSFLKLLDQPNRSIFLFKKDKDIIDRDQWNNKEADLLSLSTMIADPHNTLFFFIGKDSIKKHNNLSKIKYNISSSLIISLKRSQHILSKTLSEYRSNGRLIGHIYRKHVGEMFQIDPNWAQENGLLSRDDIKRAQSFNEKLSDYVNQSVIVLTYPCFREMCQHMKTELKWTCEEIPEECKEAASCK